MSTAESVHPETVLPQRIQKSAGPYAGPTGLAWMSHLRAVLDALRDWRPGETAPGPAAAVDLDAVPPSFTVVSLETDGEEHA